MPTKAPADSAQLQRKAAVVEEITQRASTASDAAVLTEYRGLTVTELADLRGRAAPGRRPSTRSSRTRSPAAPRRRPGSTTLVDAARGPGRDRVRADGGDAVTAAKALRDFAKTNPERWS